MTETAHGSAPLTRKQLRELRNKGAAPVVPSSPHSVPASAPVPPSYPQQTAASPATPTQFPQPAQAESPAPAESQLTRRQVRERARAQGQTAAHAVIDAAPAQVAPQQVAPSHSEQRPPVVQAQPTQYAPPPPPPLRSFDTIVTPDSDTAGSTSTASSLIVSQTPNPSSLIAPIDGTGEVLVTGSFNLPEGFGSNGHAPGSADDHHADTALADRELPPASSPTPIAADKAINAASGASDIIAAPKPDRSGRLILILAIIAGALALGLAGLLAAAFMTGIFQ